MSQDDAYRGLVPISCTNPSLMIKQIQLDSDDEHGGILPKMRSFCIIWRIESGHGNSDVVSRDNKDLRLCSRRILDRIPISDCTGVGNVEPDAVDPSLEYVSRPLKRKRSADISTYDVCEKRARTPGTSSDATKAEDRACFGLGHIPIHGCTKTVVVEPDADPSVAPNIDIHVLLETIARPQKRKRCADTTTDEVRVKRRRLSDSPSDASKLKSGGPLGPHPRCMITGCVSAEVEACYILPPDMPQPLAYKYCVVVEDEHPSSSCIPKHYTITPPVATTCSSYRSLGWHELSANLHLMTIRVGREFTKRPLHYELHLSKDALVHIPTITPVYPDVVEPVVSHIKRDSPVEVIPRLPKRKRSPDIETDEVPAKRMRTSSSARNTSQVEDSVPFGPHPRCMITGCVSAEVKACYILPPDMPQLLAYKYCIIAEEEHPPDSCTTMNNIITPSVMTAPCSYRSLGWHKLNANLHLMIFRAGQKLSKRPLHYRHVLRDLLPPNEVDHAYSILEWHVTWTAPLPCELVPDRRLWATGELSACPKNYYRPSSKQYCSPLLDDETVRFRRQFRPILSGIKRRCFGDTSGSGQDYIGDAGREVSIRQWCLDCDHARDEWMTEPPAEPEDAEMLAYRQEEAGDVQPVVQDLWQLEDHFSNFNTWNRSACCQNCKNACQVMTIQNGLSENLVDPLSQLELISCGIGCISDFTSGRGDDMQLHAWRWRDGVRHLPGVGAYRLASIENIRKSAMPGMLKNDGS
ncbi:predicted protein [Postia placenta Mad-698-R]|nr:predicted protein [Postia placenta Mad-698-R]